jgi:hypothetical protein
MRKWYLADTLYESPLQNWRIAMSCPRCGAESRPDQGFCAKCGAPLATAEGAQSATGIADAPAAQAMPEPPPPSPTLLHPIPEGGLTIEEVAAWLQSEGYSASLVTGESGRRHIESITQGFPLNIFLGDCKGERCAFLEFAAGFAADGKFDISQINAWNYDNRWCRAYYDDVNDPWLRMDIDLWPGGTYESLKDRFATWNRTLGSFLDTYGMR